MWHIAHPPRIPTPDLDCFVAVINEHAAFFAPDASLHVARAPGRLDLMGGIADYSGSLVLELPLGLATFVAVQPAAAPEIVVVSTTARELGDEAEVVVPLDALLSGGAPRSYADAQALLSADPRRAWAAYPLGVLLVLLRERGLPLDGGLRLLIHSDVPTGKGVSSSAAVEVATMQALCSAYDLPLDGRETAILCQQAENLVVGAPCGVMDQMTSACGEQDQLLALLCQPAELQPAVPLPSSVEVWGIDSGIRHAVSGADYGSVRVGAFMGLRMIADITSAAGESAPYLANITPSLWESRFREHVPETLDGAAFLEQYGSTGDSVTRVEPERSYAVRQPTAHPIYEHQRVRLFRALLEKLSNDERRTPVLSNVEGANDDETSVEETATLLGELMYQSHASYSACGLGSDGTDRLVELVRQAGAAAGLFSAKITGGGSGGTVAVLARRGAEAAVRQVAQQYEQETGRAATLIGGSSPGVAAWGTAQLVFGT